MKDWTNITYNDFIKLKEIDEKEISIDEKQVEYLAVFLGKNIDEINSMTIADLSEYTKQLNSIIQPDSFRKAKEDYFKKHKKYKDIVLNDSKYEIKTNFMEYTYAQWVAYQEYYKAGDNISLVATIIVPKGKKYGQEYDMEEVKEYIGNLPFLEVQAILFFWLRTLVTLTNNSLQSSFQLAKKEIWKMKWKKMTFKQRIKSILGLH